MVIQVIILHSESLNAPFELLLEVMMLFLCSGKSLVDIVKQLSSA